VIGENVDHHHFVAISFEKIPQNVRCQLYMQKPEEEEWTVSKLRQMLGKYIFAMEMAGNESSDAPVPPSTPSSTNQQNRPLSFKSTTGGVTGRKQ